MRFELSFGKPAPAPPAAEARTSLENPSVSLVDPKAWAQIFGEWRSSAGIAVDADVAMTVPSVWCAVNFLANSIASLPLKLHRKTAKGPVRVETGRLAQMLAGTVNEDLLTSFNWRRDAMVSVLLKGRSLTYIERVGGDAVNLWPLDLSKTTVKRVAGRLEYHYRATAKSSVITYTADEIIDLKFLGKLDGVDVFDPVMQMKDSIGLAVALREYASRFFRNGGVPPLSMTGPAASPAAVNRARNDMGEVVKDTTREGENIIYVPLGHELKAVGFDPEKGAMIESQRFCLEETSRTYNLPPAFLHNLERATFGNVEQQDLNLVKHCLVHWVEQIEQECNAKLFRNARGRYAEFDLNGLLRGDFLSRMQGYAAGILNAVLKPNEARRRENLPDDPAGDKLFIQSATVPIDTAGSPAGNPGGEQDTPGDPPAPNADEVAPDDPGSEADA